MKKLLNNYCSVINGGAWSEDEYVNEGIPVLRVSNMVGGAVVSKDDKFLSEASRQAYAKHELAERDTLIATVGSHPTQQGSVVGRTVRVPSEWSGAYLNQNAACLRIDGTDEVDSNFFWHLTNTVLFKHHIESRARGSANQVRMAIGELKKFEYDFPDIETQRKIAAILTAYDDLIETNKRRIALLEKMAEELYREWFVRMRFPGHQNTRFVKGVPEGWEPIRMGALVEHYIGGGWGEEDQSTEYSEPAFVIRGTDVPKVQLSDISSVPHRFHTTSNLQTRVMQPDDFVFEASGGSKNQLLGRNVRVSSVLLDSLTDPVIPASFCKLIRFDRKKVSPYLMQLYLKLFYDQGLVGIFQVQSTGISNYQFESFLKFHKMLIPPASQQSKFEDLVKPMLDQKDHLGLQISAAAKASDLLLPRLISGKLSVEDLDIQFPPSMCEVGDSGL